jgi:hypothetical protein
MPSLAGSLPGSTTIATLWWEHFGLSPADDELVGITAAMASRSADEEVPRAFV